MEGHLSAQGAVFIAVENTTTANSYSFTFEGAYSGEGAQIICGDGKTCSITCLSNGCNNLNVGCDVGATCTINFNCNQAIYDNQHCTDAPALPDGYYLPTLFNLSVSEHLDDSVTICNISTMSDSSINCDAVQECRYATSGVLDTIEESICCTAEESCRYASDIVSGDGLRCDGYLSCSNVNDIQVTAGSGDDIGIYFAGTQAGNAAAIQTTNNFNIYCSGMQSCNGLFVENGKNIYCLGSRSCQYLKIPSYSGIIGDLFIYGNEGAFYMNVTNIGGSVYCSGYRSCWNTQMTTITGDIVSAGYETLRQATIQAVGHNVVGAGDRNMYEANIQDVASVC